MTLNEIETPALILNLARLKANTQRMSARARSLGVDLRPHMKTAKSTDVARLATAGHSGGITVSTLREAEYFAGHGVRDMIYAVGIAPAKLARVASVQAQGVRVAVITDTPTTARDAAARADGLGATFDVLIEIDTGAHRAGVAPDSETLMELGRIVHEAHNLELRGVLTHAGQSYACRSVEEVIAVAETERAGAVMAAERLRAAGLPCPVVSVGSTPTAVHARSLEGVTEMRPGVYMFNDVYQAQIGSCAIEDVAVSVLATVTSHHPERGEIVIDAGGLAISLDRSTAAGPRDVHYGLVADGAGRGHLPEMHVVRVSQEHGIVACANGAAMPFADLPPGARVRVLPNHACFTAAAYDRYHVIEGEGTPGNGDEPVIAEWPRVNGWLPD